MVDYHISVLFKPHDYSGDNYLRIDYDKLTKEEGSMDLATQENLKNLKDVGNKLLTLPVSRKNFDTGKLEPTGDQTNKQALDREDTELGGQKIAGRGEAMVLVQKAVQAQLLSLLASIGHSFGSVQYRNKKESTDNDLASPF
ncbi:hypothetical protein FEM48_Zijuj08G0114500 [Ziziphus jujuba var. spinosa]|uniref:Uncharacterized protein n=1 Tax=Ziziphus jujuba var. spinosa TaxID=714518 RepID=A0A978UYU0_ZIZJJ|nr:hypothetical protein FEM48_Zijuj08G0114500 [Ziziphus jujuba var. spinosa]